MRTVRYFSHMFLGCFSDHFVQGTAPFTSTEILSFQRMFHIGQPKPTYRTDPDGKITNEWLEHIKKWGDIVNNWNDFSDPDGCQSEEARCWQAVCHDAIHDLESLFWIITYICLTRGGSGGHWRQELQADYTPQSPEESHLRNIHTSLFAQLDPAALASFKATMFVRDQYGRQVSTYFHPYFAPLKPLMDRWWQILCTAHKYPIFEGFFDYVLAAVRGAGLGDMALTP